ncbi:MAG TPA: Gfo/Idh/MocA family oxidoreductase [Planctomycetota bacterium]|nr:Gfo/Idh/MocA family oxidoreductase [Planctomycetota bacterium]
MNRRDFLRHSSTAAAGFWIAGRQTGYGQEKSPNAKLNVGHVGVAGMRGADHLGAMGSQNQVALCDVDDKNLAQAAVKLPGAATYADFREMLEKEKSLDCVVLSTPDHIHAPAGVMAMKLGRHLYTEKPMARTVYEVRVMTQTAAERKLKTQMGTQIHAGDNYRRVVELVQGGAIGAVREAHVWLGPTPWTAAGLPKDDKPAPEGLHWDLWLGPSEERPYSPRYHPMKWRCYWNFGGGHLADMGCHYIDLVFWSLKLGHCATAEAEGPEVDEHGAPPWLVAKWSFPARGELPPCTLTWYHGDKAPAALTEKKLGDWKGPGVLFIGDKGMLVSNYGQHKLLPEPDFKDYVRPEPTIAKSLGHHQEWIEAIRGGKASLCAFDYSGPLAETVLLGNVAYRTGRKLDWDAVSLKAKNCPEADRFLRRDYRKGWTL